MAQNPLNRRPEPFTIAELQEATAELKKMAAAAHAGLVAEEDLFEERATQ